MWINLYIIVEKNQIHVLKKQVQVQIQLYKKVDKFLMNRFISERDNLHITITRREYLFRIFRFLVIYCLLPNLAKIYLYFNLLDL